MVNTTEPVPDAQAGAENVPASDFGVSGGHRLWERWTGGRSAVASSVRLALLLVAALLIPLTVADTRTTAFLGAVLAAALVGTALEGRPRVRLAVLVIEAALIAVGVLAADAPPLPLLVCLPSTTVAAGLLDGLVGVGVAGGTAAILLLVGRVAPSGDPVAREFSGAAAQWVLIAVVTGVLAARIYALTPGADGDDRYLEAHRLLAQLRAVTRGLPGSLDPGTVANSLLDEAIARADCKHGCVLLHVGGGELVPLALRGYRRVPWRAGLAEDGPISRSWLSGAPVVDHREPDTRGARRGSTLLVLPIGVEGDRVGVLALEWHRPDVETSARIRDLNPIVARYCLPLETAALFDKLRIGAATEERSRLAREMHDGIAQDLAFLGYELDALTASLRREDAEESVQQARELRNRITALISDLRLSISDLRSSVGPGRGLGAALSEYVRSAGTSARFTVHLTLNERSTRLPADTEVQLLRIAHEAIGEARKNQGTRNLWVTLDVDPPSAELLIEDDGLNRPIPDNEDHSAARNMGERAARLGADFSRQPRKPTGTRVRVVVRGASGEH
jgi:signal transduction histidine kinase